MSNILCPIGQKYQSYPMDNGIDLFSTELLNLNDLYPSLFTVSTNVEGTRVQTNGINPATDDTTYTIIPTGVVGVDLSKDTTIEFKFRWNSVVPGGVFWVILKLSNTYDPQMALSISLDPSGNYYGITYTVNGSPWYIQYDVTDFNAEIKLRLAKISNVYTVLVNDDIRSTLSDLTIFTTTPLTPFLELYTETDVDYTISDIVVINDNGVVDCPGLIVADFTINSQLQIEVESSEGIEIESSEGIEIE